jgi:methionine-rich copper-binding protein CopC
VSRAGRATADLLDRHGKRVAHLATRVHGAAKLTLRPAHRLSAGRYVIRLRVTATGRTLVMTRSVHIV